MNDVLAVNLFCERTSSQKLDWVLNMPLTLSSNVIWRAYRLVAETKIFRLVVSLFYVKEEWIGKKYNKKDITYYFKYRELSGIFKINNQF